MNFPLSYHESNECCWVEDATGKALLLSAFFAQVNLDKSVPITEDDDAHDATARETLKELVRLANLEALRLGWYKL